MADNAQLGRGGGGNIWRMVGWGAVAFLLLLPAVAMQFTTEVNWTASDFVFAGVLLVGTALIVEFTVRRSDSGAYRAAVGAAIAAAFLIIWANGAVGMIGNEDNPYNLLFLGVILLAIAGAIAVRFRASGMAFVMTAAALAHGAIAMVGMFSDLRGGIFSLVFAGLWLLSSALFHAAGQQRAP